MHRKAIISLMVIAMALHAMAARAAITFVYPAQKSWVKRSDYLILKLNNPEITGVRITVNGLASDLLPVGTPEYRKVFQDMLILQPIWDPGKNEVIVEGVSGEKVIETVKNDIIYNAKGDPAAVPKEYRPNVVHTPETEKLCAPCHTMNPTEAEFNSTPEQGNPCYKCHRKMMNVKFVHGPAGTFSCSYCHSLTAKPKYAVTRRDAALCNECHADKAEGFKKRKYLHGPIDGGLCEVCHDSHGSPYPAQLRMPINELCLSCHAKIANEPHAVRTPKGEGHPLSGRPDISPKGKGRDISCVSCHEPHASDARRYFQSNEDEKMKLCQMCHKY